MNLKEKIFKAVEVLEAGGIILYPTDTVWGIGCDATNLKAVDKIFTLKKRQKNKSMIVLVDSESRLQRLVDVPNVAWDILDCVDKPTTIVYDTPTGIANNLIAQDNSIGIRVVKNYICEKLIQGLNKPITSTSANISGQLAANSFKSISNEILEGVDYILNDDSIVESSLSASSIIKLSLSGIVKVIRK